MVKHQVKIVASGELDIDFMCILLRSGALMRLLMHSEIELKVGMQPGPCLTKQPMPGKFVCPPVKVELQFDGSGRIIARLDLGHQPIVAPTQIIAVLRGPPAPAFTERKLFQRRAKRIKFFQIAL